MTRYSRQLIHHANAMPLSFRLEGVQKIGSVKKHSPPCHLYLFLTFAVQIHINKQIKRNAKGWQHLRKRVCATARAGAPSRHKFRGQSILRFARPSLHVEYMEAPIVALVLFFFHLTSVVPEVKTDLRLSFALPWPALIETKKKVSAAFLISSSWEQTAAIAAQAWRW